MKTKELFTHIILAGFLFLQSQLSIGAAITRYSGFGGSYNINPVASNVVLSQTAVVGSDGARYYLVAPQGQNGIVIGLRNSQPSGQVNCKAHFLLGNYEQGLWEDYAFHRLFAYMPDAGFAINGAQAYRINSNTFFTLYTSSGMEKNWFKMNGQTCARSLFPIYNPTAADFTVQFPFEIRLYVKNIPIDGKIIIPGGTIAGYTRMFQDVGTPDVYVPVDKAMIKINLATTVINYPSNCKISVNDLNINHQTLDSSDFNSKETRTATYECSQGGKVKVKFSLDYITDSDPQKRLPLKSGNNTVYSELTLYDAESNQRGKSFEADINKIKNIQIESKLSGTNVEPGKYTGNAWLIATYI